MVREMKRKRVLVSDESKKGQKGGEEMDMATQC
jgi:hypothetical protein